MAPHWHSLLGDLNISASFDFENERILSLQKFHETVRLIAKISRSFSRAVQLINKYSRLVRPLVPEPYDLLIITIQFAKSQKFSNVWVLQIFERKVLLSKLNSTTIFVRDILSSDGVAKSATQMPWVFCD